MFQNDNDNAIIDLLDKRVRKQEQRRHFFRKSAGLTAGLATGVILGACGSSGDDAVAQTGPTDPEILNFALNLEYLEAQFYQMAAYGRTLPANLLTGAGRQGAVSGGHIVPFKDPLVAAYAKEIADDEVAHVAFLCAALGSAAVAQPAINIDGASATGAFSVAARAAGLITAGQTFDPYADDNSFLLGAYIFEDVGVTAYKGASPLIQNKTFLEAAAGILAAEAYHAGLVRAVLYSKGLTAQAQAISDARDSLDGATDLDQGIGTATVANIVPLDANGIAYSRTPGQVLNIVFLNKAAVTQGGFFPAGVNGTLAMSAPN